MRAGTRLSAASLRAASTVSLARRGRAARRAQGNARLAWPQGDAESSCGSSGRRRRRGGSEEERQYVGAAAPGAEGEERMLLGAERGESIPSLPGEERGEPSPGLCSAAPPEPLWDGGTLLCLGLGALRESFPAESPVPTQDGRCSRHQPPCQPPAPSWHPHHAAAGLRATANPASPVLRETSKLLTKSSLTQLNESFLGDNSHHHQDPPAPLATASPRRARNPPAKLYDPALPCQILTWFCSYSFYHRCPCSSREALPPAAPRSHPLLLASPCSFDYCCRNSPIEARLCTEAPLPWNLCPQQARPARAAGE